MCVEVTLLSLKGGGVVADSAAPPCGYTHTLYGPKECELIYETFRSRAAWLRVVGACSYHDIVWFYYYLRIMLFISDYYYD